MSKKIHAVRIITAGILCAALPQQAVQAESRAVIASRMASVTLAIQNMTCDTCRFTIQNALQKVAGVQKVTVDYNNNNAVVYFDPDNTAVAMLITAATYAGYTAIVLPDQSPER